MSSAIKYSFVGILITAVVAIILWKPGADAQPSVDRPASEENSAKDGKAPDALRRSDSSFAAAMGRPATPAPSAGPERPLQLVAGGRTEDPRDPESAMAAESARPSGADPLPERALQSGHVPSRPSESPAAGPRTHVVGPGESLYKIAEKYYGRGSLWRRLHDANPGIAPDRLRAGTKLVIPELADATASQSPATAPGAGAAPRAEPPSTGGQRVHLVEKGESLYEIAQEYYGSGREWRRIRDANSIEDWQIRAGMKLVIPPR